MARSLRFCFFALLALSLVACASLSDRDPLHIALAGLEPLPGEGLEVRFAVKLRVQNPNDSAVDFDGVALELEVNGRPLASGVSDQRGSVPRFGETLISVPVSISAFSAMRQAWGATGYVAMGHRISADPCPQPALLRRPASPAWETEPAKAPPWRP